MGEASLAAEQFGNKHSQAKKSGQKTPQRHFATLLSEGLTKLTLHVSRTQRKHSSDVDTAVQEHLRKWQQVISSDDQHDRPEKLRTVKLICGIVDPWGKVYYGFLVFMSVAVLYNVFSIPLRLAFYEIDKQYITLWTTLDLVATGMYFVDIVVQARTGYLGKDGTLVSNAKRVARHYIKSRQFLIDAIAAIPFAYFASHLSGVAGIWYRLLTLLKLPRLRECSERGWRLSAYPLVFRFGSVAMVLLILLHYNTCVYYKFSENMGFSTNRWVFDAITYPEFPANYLNCLYWVACHISGVNGLPRPERTSEIIFMTINYMIRVLYVANVLGDIASIFSSGYEKSLQREQIKDELKAYMEKHSITRALQNKILAWMEEYQAEHGGGSDKGEALQMLPRQKLTQINMDIHLTNLKKVRLFQSQDPLLLVHLVNLLKLQLFCPGDFVCTRGEVGTEMYIVKSGLLDVIGFDDRTIMTTLRAGTIFGELALLDIKGAKHGNRRTATVVSRGYTHAYTLSKEDLWDVFDLFPGAREEFDRKGREILAKDGLLHETAAQPSDQMSLLQQAARLEERCQIIHIRLDAFELLMRTTDREHTEALDRIECRMDRIIAMIDDQDIDT